MRVAALLLCACSTVRPAPGPAPAATPAPPTARFVAPDPLSMPSGGGAGGGGGGPSSFTLPNKIAGHLVSNRVPAIAVDARGGVHVVYAANAVDAEGHRPAFYAYCPSACTRPERFSGVRLGDGLGDAQLGLDGDGHPRVLLSVGPDPDNTVDHQVWVCDRDCTEPGSWRGSSVARVKGSFFPGHVEHRRSFAVDAHGRIRFVFTGNAFGGEFGGTAIAVCDRRCGEGASWRVGRLSDLEWKNLSLALTADGLPRLAFTAQRPEPDYEPILHYLSCERPDCSGAAASALLITTTAGVDSDPVFALRLDPAGRPRIALYPGSGTGGTLAPNHLYYLACDADCGDHRRWGVLDVGVEERGGEGGVDLAIDAAGRPRIAYRVPAPVDELAVAGCDGDCMAGGKSWLHGMLPSTRAVEAELGLPPRMGCPDCIPPIPPCPAAFWDAGWWPSIAASGDALRIVYEAQLQVGGGACTAGTLGRVSRLATVPLR